MGREIKRVPLDFDFPHSITGGTPQWPGYLRCCNPGGDDCLDGCKHDCPECADVDPPTGEGWQLWQNTGEGSPMSPVFATGDELAEWISRNPVGFAGARIALDDAKRWVYGPGWAADVVIANGVMTDGITGSPVNREAS